MVKTGAVKKIKSTYARLSLKQKVGISFLAVFLGFLTYFVFGFVNNIKKTEEHYISSVTDILAQTAIHFDYRSKEMLTISNSVYMLLNKLAIPKNPSDLQVLNSYYTAVETLGQIRDLYTEYEVKIYTKNETLLAAEKFYFFPEEDVPEGYYEQTDKSGKPVWFCDSKDDSYQVFRSFVKSDMKSMFSALTVKIKPGTLKSILPSTMPDINFGIMGDSGLLMTRDEPSKEKPGLQLEVPMHYSEWRVAAMIPGWVISQNGKAELVTSLIILVVLTSIWFLNLLYIYRVLIARIVQVKNQMLKVDYTEDFRTLPAREIINDEIGVIERTFYKTCLKVSGLIEDVQRTEEKKKKFEFEAMQKLINPHFLYNCLDAINWMAFDAGANRISEFTSTLGRFYRLCLHKGMNIIPLRDELEICKQYVKIQQIRYQNRLNVFFTVDKQAEDAMCVKLCIQPLLENAIKHGIYSFEEGTSHAVIIVDGYVIDGVVHVDIINNSHTAGVYEEVKTEFDKEHSGFGLKNTRDRLELYFDKADCGVSMDVGEWTIVNMWFAKKNVKQELIKET